MSAASSLTQGLALLEAAVAQERSGRQGHNASRLAQATGIERSRVSRLTQELRTSGYLDRDDASVLSAGANFFATAAALNIGWLRAARGELRALASRLGMTARVTVAAGPGALLLRYETGVGAGDPSTRAGMVTPIWCTGGGRALLWDFSLDELARLLHDVQFVGVGGPAAARTVEDIDALLVRDRERGIIIAAEEYVEGVHEYALPLRVDGSVLASLSVSGPRLSASRQRSAHRALEASIGRLADHASQIAR